MMKRTWFPLLSRAYERFLSSQDCEHAYSLLIMGSCFEVASIGPVTVLLLIYFSNEVVNLAV